MCVPIVPPVTVYQTKKIWLFSKFCFSRKKFRSLQNGEEDWKNENLPCHQLISILCRVCWTHTQKCSRSMTTSTSLHPGKTMSSVIFQWTWKVFTYSLLREKWKTRMDKSSIVVIRTNSWVWVSHPWISTWSLSKGKTNFKRTCKSNRWPTTQTLWCGGSTIRKSFPTWLECLDSTWQYLSLLRLVRGSSVVWNLYRLTCVGAFWTPPWLTDVG